MLGKLLIARGGGASFIFLFSHSRMVNECMGGKALISITMSKSFRDKGNLQATEKNECRQMLGLCDKETLKNGLRYRRDSLNLFDE